MLWLDDNTIDAETRWCALEPPNGEDLSSFLRRHSRLDASDTLGELQVRVSLRAQAGRPEVGATSLRRTDGSSLSIRPNQQMISRWFEEDDPTNLRTPNVLRVAVVSARDFELPRRQSMRMGVSRIRPFSTSCDPQAVVRYRGLTRKTKIVRRTQRPVWGTTFDLPRPDDGGTEILKVDVYDVRSFREPRRLGRAQVNCSTSSVEAQEVALDTKGYVSLAWKLAYDPAFDETSDCDWFSSISGGLDPRSKSDDAQPDEVHVVIVRVRTIIQIST